MVKFVNILASLGAATVNPGGSIESTTRSHPDATTSAPNTGEDEKVMSATTMCPVTGDAINEQWARFHGDNVCNKDRYNRFIDSLDRSQTYQELKETGDHMRVPNEKTITCPAVVHNLKSPDSAVGYDVSWIVENTASTPVVLSYINAGGVECSALDADISPPEADPDAILQPGHWKVVRTYEGHVFHARELLPDGSPGKVLLQHRVGLIPVAENTKRNLVCPDVDHEPLVTLDDGTEEVDPDYARDEARDLRDCNQLEIGFRNMAGCPLHGYFLRPDSCEEVFHFHLGVESNVEDFVWDWQSETKFMSTFIGHTFVFRSAFSDQVVDTVTLQPTQIVDCPDLQQTVATALSTQAIILPSGEQLRNNGNVSNNTTTAATGALSRPQLGSRSLFYASSTGGSL